MKTARIYSLLVFVITSFYGLSQIQVTNTQTASQLVQNTLIGTGVSVSNITFSGQQAQIGYFDDGTSNIGLPFGIMLSSGNVVDAVPPNQPQNGQFGGPGDPDLVTVAQSVTSNPASGSINQTFDAAILEFDFVPIGDTVRFNFVFASEEYTTYINTQFNDAFGFFISGPGYAGPYAAPVGFPNGAENLAVVPGTTDPITISTIQPGLNAAYYIGSPVGHSFNGFTVPITIEFPVVCGQTYHFKFAVADCQDDYLDTAVFLEGQSFSSEAVQVSVATVTGDTVVVEGCSTADFIFSRPNTTDTLLVNYTLTGTAIEGTDYPNLPNPVTFLPGEDTVILTLDPINDGLVEPWGESVIITAYTVTPCGDTIASVGTVWILDIPIVNIDEQDTILPCPYDTVLVSAIATSGLGPFSYSWSTGSNTSTTMVYGSLSGPTDYYVTVTDFCGNSTTDTLTVVINQTLQIDSVTSLQTSTCLPNGSVSGYASGTTGNVIYTWSGPGSGSPNTYVNQTWGGRPSGWYYLNVTDDACWVEDSVFVSIADPPIASIIPSATYGCSPLTVTFENASQNGTQFGWDLGSGIFAANQSLSPSQTFTSNGTVMLIAFDQYLCSDTAWVDITVTSCGCTDPNAANYDPNAIVDDGSCFYPIPEVICPNIFTPNGDDNNDLFFLNVKNGVSVEMVILNRWGNVVFEGSGIGTVPSWNGSVSSTTIAEEGTYFVKYTVVGIDGTTVAGHGFVQLVR